MTYTYVDSIIGLMRQRIRTLYPSFTGKGDSKKSATNREYALSVLSQGLEENPTSPQLWIEYLKLYALNYDSVELREVCYHAVMYAANYQVKFYCF